MSALVIAGVELRRMLRDRTNLFFVFIFPLLLVVLIGASFGGDLDTRFGVVLPPDDGQAAALVDDLDATDSIRVVEIEDSDALENDVSDGFLSAGVVVPAGFGEAIRTGEAVRLTYVGRPDATAASLRALVDELVAQRSAVTLAAMTAADVTAAPVDQLLGLARNVQEAMSGVSIETEAVGGDELAQEFEGLGQFDLGASSQLFLFTFLTATTAGVALIQARQLGVVRRMSSTPTTTASIIAGQAAGRVLVAVAQAAYIVAATWLLFRVNWGQPLATTAVILLFCLVAGGAGMLVGATLRNESQAAAAGVGAGLGLAALGGSMVPMELFPDTMRTLALATPHAWANRAMADIVRRDAGLGDVALEVVVLAGFAVALLGLATWRLRRGLTR